MGPVDFELIEVLEEVDDCNHGVHEVRDEDDKVAASLSRLTHIPNSNGRDDENEDRCQPDQPMGAELLRCSLESLVGEVPLEVDEAPGDLAQKADHQESKLQVGFVGPGDELPSAESMMSFLWTIKPVQGL
jgi:hypothetical protein